MGGGISSNKRQQPVAPVIRQQSPQQSVRVSARTAPSRTGTSAPQTATETSARREVNTVATSANYSPVPPTDADVSLAIAFTPRENEKSSAASSFSGVPYTPHGDEASVFKYYCPLCMQYFKQIMKMKCCSNYLCVQCCKDYVATKNIKMAPNDGITNIEDQFMDTNSIYCPHCQVAGFHPLGVSSEEIVRDYYQSAPQNHSIAAYSPLRVGETFEDLKRKMIPYKSFHATTEEGQDEQVQPYDPLSPLSLMHSSAAPGIAGIAMLSGAGDETPTLRSPRMRLEPDTPGQVSFSLYNPDHSAKESRSDREGRGGESLNRLFQDDNLGHHTAPRDDSAAESKSGDEAAYNHVAALFDLCSGGDSPRVHSGRRNDAPHGHPPSQNHAHNHSPVPHPYHLEVSRSVGADRPPLSRVNSTARVADDSALTLSSRQASGHPSPNCAPPGQHSTHSGSGAQGACGVNSSEKARLRVHVATSMVDHMMQSALAQYAYVAVEPLASQ